MGPFSSDSKPSLHSHTVSIPPGHNIFVFHVSSCSVQFQTPRVMTLIGPRTSKVWELWVSSDPFYWGRWPSIYVLCTSKISCENHMGHKAGWVSVPLELFVYLHSLGTNLCWYSFDHLGAPKAQRKPSFNQLFNHWYIIYTKCLTLLMAGDQNRKPQKSIKQNNIIFCFVPVASGIGCGPPQLCLGQVGVKINPCPVPFHISVTRLTSRCCWPSCCY